MKQREVTECKQKKETYSLKLLTQQEHSKVEHGHLAGIEVRLTCSSRVGNMGRCRECLTKLFQECRLQLGKG